MPKTTPEKNPEEQLTIDQKDVRVIKQFAAYLEQIKFDQYLARQSNTKKVLWYNLIAGVAHGFGYIIGATIFIAYFWLILEWLGGLPWVGRIIAQIVEIVLRHQMSS